MLETYATKDKNMYRAYLKEDGKCVGRCGISVTNNVWVISEWFVDHNYMHRGYGKRVLRDLAHNIYYRYGRPRKIKYIWNGANEYVYDWMVRNFNAKCTCPMWELKTLEEDLWLAHEYELDIDKFVEYIEK